MAIFDDMDELEVEKNKAVRGYLIRLPRKGEARTPSARKPQITKYTGHSDGLLLMLLLVSRR